MTTALVIYENKIPITKGMFVSVGYWIYSWLMQWRWSVMRTKHILYARANVKVNGKRKVFLIHRLIMNAPKELFVDHVDHNGLNNLPNNLRLCNPSQNTVNKIKRRGASKYLGVSVKNVISNNVRYRYWRSEVVLKGQVISLGNFKTEEEAAIAYDIGASKYHGEFANLNFK